MKRAANISTLLLMLIPVIGLAQQLPQFSQYMYNMISVNPAYAGSREIMVINILNRNQWLGVEGAPVTQTLSAHTSIPNSNVGVGVSVINDKIGYERTTYAFADVSYKLRLDAFDEYQLTFGIKGGFRKYSIDEELLNDPAAMMDPFLEQVDYSWAPNFGVGMYFRGDSFYLGLSSPKLFTPKNSGEFLPIDRVSYFFNGGYLFDVNRNLQWKPTFLVKYTDGAPLSFDFSSMFYINEYMWLGVSYRVSDSVGAIVNFKITDGLSAGYSYDYVTSDLTTYTSGSHEIMINYEFEFPKPRCKCKDLYN